MEGNHDEISSTASNTPTLPSELIDCTLECMSPLQDKPTFEACSRVCRRWISCGRRQLFRNIIISYHTLPDFADFVGSQTAISQYVRQLSMITGGGWPDDTQSISMSNLSFIITALTQLQSLKFLQRIPRPVHDVTDSASMEEIRRFRIDRLVHSNEWTPPETDGFSNFLEILQYFFHVGSLEIGNELDDSRDAKGHDPWLDDAAPPDIARYAAPEGLEIDSALLLGYAKRVVAEMIRRGTIGQQLTPLDFGHLRLGVAAFLSGLFHRVGERLLHFKCKILSPLGDHFAQWETHVSQIAHCRSLRSLTISLETIYYLRDSGDTKPPWICALTILRHCPSTLTHIKFHIQGTVEGFLSDFVRGARLLRDTLRRMPDLVSVEIVLQLSTAVLMFLEMIAAEERGGMDIAAAAIFRHLREVDERGILHVTAEEG